MHIDRIVRCTRLDDLFHHSTHLLEDLDTLYDQAWERATADVGSRTARRAKLTLMWVIHARKPLTIDLLSDILVTSEIQDHRERLTKEDLLSSCAGLVRIESGTKRPRYHDEPESQTSVSSDSIVTMVHPSAHRYLDDRRETFFPCASELVVTTCLLLLNADEIAHALKRPNALIAV